MALLSLLLTVAAEPFRDPYLDPPTGILLNIPGFTSGSQLRAFEADAAFLRGLELAEHTPTPTRDLAELQSIHGYIFQDVYDWAGDLRTVDIHKTGTSFMPVSRLATAADYVFSDLQSDRLLQGLVREQFIHDAGWRVDWTKITGADNDRASQAAAVKGDLQPLIDLLDSSVSLLNG